MARHRNKKTHCLNCDYSFIEEENYCPNCSQENHDLKIPFKHFVEEFLEGIIHFDSKVWHSIKTLFIYPGKITKDFLAGKRVSFVPPIRLYVFFSFVFFFFLNMTINHKNDEKKITDIIKFEAKGDSVDMTIDSLRAELESKSNKDIEEKEVKSKLLKILDMKGKDVNAINQTIYKYMSFVLFLLLPIFALIMKIVYYKSRKYYYEHFIAAIHYHVIVFIILLLVLGAYSLKLPNYVYGIIFISAFIYFVNSLKIVYNSTWLKSILKAIVIFIIYGLIFGFVTLLVSFYVGYNYIK